MAGPTASDLLRRLVALLVFLTPGCVAAPEGIEPVAGFELQRYLGTWYEIARLDHSFERGLTDVTAQYSRHAAGGVRVVNRGFDPEAGKWKTAEGRAYFLGDPGVASLKVSFFGPFYGGYHVVDLDREDYGYALVAGPSRSYLWILARTPTLDPPVRERLIHRAIELGFPTEGLIFVRHDPDRARR